MLDDARYLALLRRRITRARKASGLTQTQVANAIGMQPKDFQRFESLTGKKPFNPTILNLRRIAQTVDVDVGDLTREPDDAELEETFRVQETPLDTD